MAPQIKRVAILGSTGSIGRQTLEVVRAFPRRLKVVGLGVGQQAGLLMQQAREFQPRWLSIAGPPPIGEGYQWVSLEEMACLPEVDLVVVATSGRAGLLPTLAALRAGKTVALANKEVLVMAGEIVMAEAQRHRARLLPLDSEHSAIWQCLRGERGRVARLILTASGGPFRSYSQEQLARVTAAEALRHPTWLMGPKVTIDAATLMNKGMEAIEAHWLFRLPWDRIQVVLHPQSLVHSLVEFPDGSVKAQLAPPDMHLPIQYALSYPQRWPNPHLPRLQWGQPLSFHFAPPDLERFPCLRLALEAGRAGDTYPAVLTGADEAAVELFLKGRIGFMDIPQLIDRALERHSRIKEPSLEAILEAEAQARQEVAGQVEAVWPS